MAFLNQKERVFDIVLTDEGRELLAKNQLNFKYYAFSDEGIDYSGSLSASSMVSSSFENYVHRDLTFEADQRKNKDLSSFLYTIPPEKNVLPEFKISVDVSSSITLDRRFRTDTIILRNSPIPTTQKPIDIVVRATVPKKTLSDRIKDYVIHQKSKFALSLILKGKK